MSEQDLKEQIGEMAYYVTQQNGTEPPFTGKYDRFFEKGIYVDRNGPQRGEEQTGRLSFGTCVSRWTAITWRSSVLH